MPGQPKPKLNPAVSQAITSAAKIHAGQLIETAKLVQIQEIKDRLAVEYPHKSPANNSNKEPDNDSDR